MPCIIGFIGRHNSGKTTVIRQVIPELQKRGYRVGLFKSTHHHIDFHPPGKDTTLYKEQGIKTIAIKGPDELALFQAVGTEPLEHTIFRLFPEEDIVILEGFKNAAGIPKIEVAANCTPELYHEINGIRAVITDKAVDHHMVLDPSDPGAVADFLEQEILSEYCQEDEVTIFINNRKLPMKFFVKNAIKGVVTGFLKSLKYTEGAKKIDIRIVLR